MTSRERILAILGRFVREGDDKLSDLEFIDALRERLRKERENPLVDPNE